MTLFDAGAIVALLYRDDDYHEPCKKAFSSLRKPYRTTWPVITEAMYLLGKRCGPEGYDALWRLIRMSGGLELVEIDADMSIRMQELMAQYSPRMDLADASLVALAERTETNVVFTIDRKDFLTYRLPGKQCFIIEPQPVS